MKIKKLRWKNFTSWGNSWHELDFDKNPGLSLFNGLNGAGKTSISLSIIYMLYGQLDNFTQKDIPNHVNKHFEGEIFFESKNHEVYIYRALSPNGFKVNVDGKDIDTAGKNNIQSWLENEIYGIPYDIFKNSIILSIEDFKSFVVLSPKDKRDIIDRIFGYHIINQASAKIKEKLKTVRNDIGQFETKLAGYNATIMQITSNIETINNKKTDTSEQETEFAGIKNILKNDVESYKNISSDVQAVKVKVESVKNEYDKLASKLSETKSKLKLYENDICPTCGERLDSEKHLHIKHELTDILEKTSEEYSDSKKELDSVYEEYNQINNKKCELVNKINELKIQYTRLETAINEQYKARTEQMDNLMSMRESIENKINPQKEEIAKLNKQLKILDIVAEIFSENGLKQYISNIYVPIINEYVSDICDILGIPYKVSFTTGYDCEIKFMGETVKYQTLSSGEKKKLDIAVTLAFLKIIKTKLADMNILFLDEALSGIDVSSCNELLKIFYDFSKNIDMRIYIVHHANLDSTYIDESIEIEKRNGFSHFVDD